MFFFSVENPRSQHVGEAHGPYVSRYDMNHNNQWHPAWLPKKRVDLHQKFPKWINHYLLMVEIHPKIINIDIQYTVHNYYM